MTLSKITKESLNKEIQAKIKSVIVDRAVHEAMDSDETKELVSRAVNELKEKHKQWIITNFK